MRLSLFVLWAITGWCGTLLLMRLRWETQPLDPDAPIPPRPNWLLLRIIGAVGGVVGGWVFTVAFGPSPETWISASPQPNAWMLVVAAATTVGAFIGASLLTDLYGLLRGSGKLTRN